MTRYRLHLIGTQHFGSAAEHRLGLPVVQSRIADYDAIEAALAHKVGGFAAPI